VAARPLAVPPDLLGRVGPRGERPPAVEVPPGRACDVLVAGQGRALLPAEGGPRGGPARAAAARRPLAGAVDVRVPDLDVGQPPPARGRGRPRRLSRFACARGPHPDAGTREGGPRPLPASR